MNKANFIISWYLKFSYYCGTNTGRNIAKPSNCSVSKQNKNLSESTQKGQKAKLFKNFYEKDKRQKTKKY